MNLDQLLNDSRFLVILGRGGVGKTTVSATLAVRAASLGLRTVVLTIDPANRLADALGVDQSMTAPTLLISLHVLLYWRPPKRFQLPRTLVYIEGK